jgi:hypothetical protein
MRFVAVRIFAGTGVGGRIGGLPGLTLGFEPGTQLVVERLHPLQECLASLSILVRPARLIVQVPLARNLGVLQAIGPASDLPRDGFAAGFEI